MRLRRIDELSVDIESMTDLEAARILESLASGENPQGPKPLSPQDLLSNREVIGALYIGAHALQQRACGSPAKKKDLPEGAGRSWDKVEEDELRAKFTAGKIIADMASDHLRTEGAIRSRLV